MSSTPLELRLVVGIKDVSCSCVWRLWANKKGDVYLAQRRLSGIIKYSFHTSGICRSAFTAERGAPQAGQDRAMHKWRRASPPAEGQFTRLAWIAFPTDYLSSATGSEGTKLTWIAPAPTGGATFIEVGLAYAWSATIEQEARRKTVFQESCLLLDGTLVVFVRAYHERWVNKDLDSCRSDGDVDLRFSVRDPANTGRPVRMNFGPRPNDGDAVLLTELGGYAVP